MPQQINLFNPLYLRQEKYFSARTMLQALGLVLVGLGAFYAYGVWQTRALERIVGDQGGEVARARAHLTALSGAGSQERLHALQAEAGRLESVIKSREELLAKLDSGDLGNSAGMSPYFAAFAQQALAGVWLTGVSIGGGGNDLQVRGRALAPDLLPAYLRSLSRSEVMRGRQVIALQLSAGAPAQAANGATAAERTRYVEFSFSAPLRAPEPGAGPAKEAAR